MDTPWGPSQSTRKLDKGVTMVTTATHGGIILDTHVAKSLSSNTRQYGDPMSGGRLAFEEDCAVTALFAERPDLYRKMKKVWGVEVNRTDSEIATHMSAQRQYWYGE